MTKIEEIIQTRFKNESAPGIGTFKDRPIKDCMIIYAEIYARKCLEIAAENARIQINYGTGIDRLTSLNYSEHNILHECFIDERTITNINLPDHE